MSSLAFKNFPGSLSTPSSHILLLDMDIVLHSELTFFYKNQTSLQLNLAQELEHRHYLKIASDWQVVTTAETTWLVFLFWIPPWQVHFIFKEDYFSCAIFIGKTCALIHSWNMHCDDCPCYVCFYPSTCIKHSTKIWIWGTYRCMDVSWPQGQYLASVAFQCDMGFLFWPSL